MSSQIPFTVDHMGGFLHPETTKKARKKVQVGALSRAELRLIEDEEIRTLVVKQKAGGLRGITDGESRRGLWHTDFLEGLNDVTGYIPETGYSQTFHGKIAPAYNIRVADKIFFPAQHPFLEDFSFLKEVIEVGDDTVIKATIPSPTMILRQEILSNDGASRIQTIYPEIGAFYRDLIQTYKDAIMAFYERGCRHLQFDDTNWAFLADQTKQEELRAKGIQPEEIAQVCTTIISEALAGKPEDSTVTTHTCRGNHAPSWLFSGGYGPIAKELFATNYDGFFLEYDSDRAGDFSSLRRWQSNGSKVVLGLVISKFPELEEIEQVKTRIEEAQQFTPLENLSISPQCGFASAEEGNCLTEKEQWRKVQLLQEIAREVW